MLITDRLAERCRHRGNGRSGAFVWRKAGGGALMRRKTLTTAIAGTALAAAAPAAHAAPTLDLGQPCYSTGDTMALTGAGWNPVRKISLSLTGAGVALNETTTDAQGNLRAELPLSQNDVEHLVPAGAARTRVVLAAMDGEAATANQPDPGVGLRVLVSHFGVAFLNQDRHGLNPRRRLALDVVGFTGLTGTRVFLHYVRGGKRRATVPLGVLTGACGDVRRTLPRAFPMRAPAAGRWDLVINRSATDIRVVPRIGADVRVRR